MDHQLTCKIFFTEFNDIRRVKLKQNKSWEHIQGTCCKYLQKLGFTSHFVLFYKDEEGDWVRIDTAEEWEEALSNATEPHSLLKLKIESSQDLERSMNCLELVNSLSALSLQPKKVSPVDIQPKIDTPPKSVPPTSSSNSETGNHSFHECPPVASSPNPNSQLFLNKEEKEPMIVHDGYQCDGCSCNPIVGNRYSCLQCGDYDLCENCYNKRFAFHQEDHIFSINQVPVLDHDEVPFPNGNQNEFKINQHQQPQPQPPQQQQVIRDEDDFKFEPYNSREPEVPKETKPSYKYEEELKIILDMGYPDNQKLRKLIEKHSGNLERVVGELVDIT